MRKYFISKYFKWAAVFLVFTLASGLVSFPWRPFHADQKSWRLPARSIKPALALGDTHGVILAPDGSLWTWGGSKSSWQVLGLGSSVRTQASLRRIGMETNWVDVAVGGSTTLALKSDGTIWGWGANYYGQLGDGTTALQQASPVPALFGNGWKQVAATATHSVALKRDGTLWAWGAGWHGELGNGSTNASHVPIQVGFSTNWVRIWSHLMQNIGQQSDCTLWFWGWDYSRSPKGSSIPIPTRVSPDKNWVSVGMGDWMVFAIKSDGTLWAWGRLAHLYTGEPSPAMNSWPSRVGTDSDWQACTSFAGSMPLFLKRNGSLWVLDATGDRGVAAVTSIVSGLVTNNQLNFVADGATIGDDPGGGMAKSLRIAFQLGETNQVLTFKENSTVRIGGTGETLTIISALYGDPKLFRDFAKFASGTQPARLQWIQAPEGIVAFCGGRHVFGFGATLTAQGEVWTWGEALGQETASIPALQTCSKLFNQIGLQVHGGDPQLVVNRELVRLEISPSQ
jgi:alpha-tubulin suppressor-like RCC1 family protein